MHTFVFEPIPNVLQSHERTNTIIRNSKKYHLPEMFRITRFFNFFVLDPRRAYGFQNGGRPRLGETVSQKYLFGLPVTTGYILWHYRSENVSPRDSESHSDGKLAVWRRPLENRWIRIDRRWQLIYIFFSLRLKFPDLRLYAGPSLGYRHSSEYNGFRMCSDR